MPKNHSINRERILVIRENHWKRYFQALGLAALIILLPATTWWWTRVQLGEDYRALQREMQQIQQQSSELQQQIEGLRQQRADLEVAAQLDRETLQQLRERLVEWREANEILEEQTQFYMSLMNPTATNAGVFVESIEINSTSGAGQYDYDVLVAQRTLDHQRVTGRVELEIEGQLEGQPATLDQAALGLDPEGLALGFRYFQHLTGSLVLPENFAAEQIRVRVYLAGSANPLLDELADWPSS